MDKKEVTIPEHIQQICRDFAAVAAKHQLNNFQGKFRPAFQDEWGADIQFWWDYGRHGDDSNQIRIQSDFVVRTQIRKHDDKTPTEE